MENEVIRLDLPATHKYLNVLGACLAEMLARVDGLPDAEAICYDVQLAVHEACTNIVDHAYEGIKLDNRIKIVLSLACQPRRLLIDLYDNGGSFDIAEVAEPDLDNGQVHGYGLFLIRSLMDEVHYRPGPGHNCWQLVKNL